jgi:monooxygenase
MNKQVDILIIGAGISGIGVASHLLKHCPHRRFDIIERRESFGGTWDFFKYPGIRSDSDMSTFGFNFKPWKQTNVLASGAAIKSYVGEVIDEYQLNQHIHFKHDVLSADYDSTTHKWTVQIQNSKGKKETWIANFVVGCTGYYNYEQGFQPEFKQQSEYKGAFIHPQHWPENLDYKNKRVLIIGSGATAITLVPSLVKGGAAHVTMLQRSPTYIASVPSMDFVYEKMRKLLPEDLAYKLTRKRNVAVQRASYALSQKYPNVMKKLLLSSVKYQLKGKVDMKHFTPNYGPWDQRLCVVPDGDLFKILRDGKASIETDQIERFTETGVILKSGEKIDADIVVSATGLNIQILGGVKASIDGQPINTSKHMLYKGILISDVPNLAMIIGYINASWTLKVDIAAEYICRLLNHMDQQQYTEVIAHADKNAISEDTVMGSLSSGYIARAADVMPKQGKFGPWRVSNNYLKDKKELAQASFSDDVLQFKKEISIEKPKPKLVS